TVVGKRPLHVDIIDAKAKQDNGPGPVPGGASTTADAQAVISNASLSAVGVAFSAVEGQTFNGVVATFQDGNSFSAPGDFQALINWGDGQTTLGTISHNGPNQFQVQGTHTYSLVGSR